MKFKGLSIIKPCLCVKTLILANMGASLQKT